MAEKLNTQQWPQLPDTVDPSVSQAIKLLYNGMLNHRQAFEALKAQRAQQEVINNTVVQMSSAPSVGGGDVFGPPASVPGDIAVYADASGKTLGDSGVLPTDLATKVGVQEESYVYAADTGAANAYVIALTPVVTAYVAGQEAVFIAAHTNTTASTLDAGGGAKNILKMSAGSLVALAAGDITALQLVTVKYDGTQWQMPASGGFTNPMTTLGDTLYEDSTPTPVRLAGNITAIRKFLRQLGTGSVSAAPAWDTVTATDVGLGNVTNDQQTKSAIVPNTAPAAGEILVGNAGGTAYAKQAVTSDLALTSAGVATVNGLKGKSLSAAGSAAGQLYIYDASNNRFVPATLTAGSNVTITNTDGAIAIATSGAGTGFFPPLIFTAPPASGWSWQSQNVGGSINTVDTTNNRIALTSDGSHDGLASYVRNVIASKSFTIIGALNLASGINTSTITYYQSGLMLTDGTQIIIFGVLYYNGTQYLVAFKWTNATTSSAAVVGFNVNSGLGNFPAPGPGTLVWLKIVEDATHRTYYTSPDGLLWNQIAQTSVTDMFTTTKYGMSIRGSGGGSGITAMYSFTESNP